MAEGGVSGFCTLRPMKQDFPFQLTIPSDIQFSDLSLRLFNGAIRLNWEPLEKLCQASLMDLRFFQEGPEDLVAALITAWYVEHRQMGGTPDAVMELFLDEMANKEAASLN